MPHAVKVIDDGLGILRTWWGEVRGEELLEAAGCFFPEEVDPGRIRYLIIDQTDVTSFDVSAESLARLLAIHERKAAALGRISIAIAAPVATAQDIARLYQPLVAARGWRLFLGRTLDDVMIWLNTVAT